MIDMLAHISELDHKWSARLFGLPAQEIDFFRMLGYALTYFISSLICSC